MSGFVYERGLSNQTIPFVMTWDTADPQLHQQTLAAAAGGPGIAHWRGPESRYYRLLFDSGSLVLKHLTEAGTFSSLTVESTTCESASLGVRRSGEIDLIYEFGSGTVRRRQSRDGGASVTSATQILAGPYTQVSHWLDEAAGMLAVAVCTSGGAWSIVVGTGPTGWTFGSPASIVTGANRRGSLVRAPDGTWELAYITTADDVAIIRCEDLAGSGAGTWGNGSTVATGTYRAVTHWWDARAGYPLVAMVDSAGAWSVSVGSQSTAGTWTFSTPQSLVSGMSTSRGGGLIRRRDGAWEWIGLTSGGVETYRICRDLAQTGAGTWGTS